METKSKKKAKPPAKKDKPELKELKIREATTIKEFAEKINLKSKDLSDKLTQRGFSFNVNDIIDESLIKVLSEELGLNLSLSSVEEEVRSLAYSRPEELIPRSPVVTIMGHVDHGKTTLLDSIRKSNIADKEAGGITQHIGASRVYHKDRFITFIDTPGHEAFTRMRARGAKLTDIVVLVVAADDGVMPQTREAINHAREAGVPIIVAINKIDKPEANIEKTKQQLSKEGLLVEEWGGDTICVEVSAKERLNIEELLEMIILLGEVMEIKANPKVPAQGVVLEARLDSKKGPLATIIVQHGVLKPGESFISGTCYGKIRALFDEHGKSLTKAEPGFPVEVLGFSEVPSPGDVFQVVNDIETAKRIVEYRLSQLKKGETRRPQHLTLEDLFKKIEEGEIKELPLIIKGDVFGSVEVLRDLLPNLSSDKIKLKIIHSAAGNITESDVLLASASKAIIIGYNLKPSAKIVEMAKEENVEIRAYNVIYELIDDIKNALRGLQEPKLREVYLGKAEVRRIFQIPKVGPVAGCFVIDGKITRNADVRVIRNNEIVYQGKISSLKHLKENVSEISKDYECGIALQKFKDIQEGDIIEAYIREKAM